MNPTGHIHPSLQGRASVYCVRFLHSLHRGAAASTCPLLSPVCLYVVCASLRVLHWRCQRVLCWSLVWLQGCWPQSQFGAEGGYWHHKAYMGPQDSGTDSQQGNKLETRLISLHSVVKTSQLSSDCTLQPKNRLHTLQNTLNYFTVKVTLFRLNRYSIFTADNIKPPISTNWTIFTAKQHNKLWSAQGASQYTIWYTK